MSARLVWDESYSVEVAMLDEQHRILFDMINALDEAADSSEESQSVTAILHRLIEYADGHFADEEGLLRDHGYPEYEEHRAEHDRFVKTVSDFAEDLVERKEGLRAEMVDFLDSWIRGHIRHTDKKYVPFLLAKGVK